MLGYRIKLEPDDNGTLLVACPALPEVTTFGENESDAIRHAIGAIEEAIAARIADGERWYEYPRYLFTNESSDILRLCGETLDQLGVAWRFSKRNTISVARREAVARLDEFVGPKY